MPNWCSNTVTITAFSDILTEIYEACEKGEFFKFCQDYDDWDYGTFIETYGSKWEPNIVDFSIDVDNDQIHITMDTAWSPPIEAYELLLNMEGVDTIYATYMEEGCDFAGIYEDGNDTCISISEAVDKIIAEEELDISEAIVADEFGDFEFQVEYRLEMEEEED